LKEINFFIFELNNTVMDKSRDILKKYWGFDQFRPLQEDIVDDAINGYDTLALLPTGGGKSICFQVPGIAREGITLVISPLIALMQDQVSNLQSRGIRAKSIISGMSYREIDITLDNARFGGLDFLYNHLIQNVFSNDKYFDFGISNENNGLQLRESLHYWKESFGARTIVQNFYEIETKNYEKLNQVLI
jgi:superfamily II DNA or RNA helicase